MMNDKSFDVGEAVLLDIDCDDAVASHENKASDSLAPRGAVLDIVLISHPADRTSSGLCESPQTFLCCVSRRNKRHFLNINCDCTAVHTVFIGGRRERRRVSGCDPGDAKAQVKMFFKHISCETDDVGRIRTRGECGICRTAASELIRFKPMP